MISCPNPNGMVLISLIIKSTCCDERAITLDLEKPICGFLPLGESPLMSHIIFDRRPINSRKSCFVNKNFSYKSIRSLVAVIIGKEFKTIVRRLCQVSGGAHQVSVDVTFDKAAVKIKNHAVDTRAILCSA